MEIFDTLDRKILAALQRQADLPLEELGARVGLSRNAVWRRVKMLEAAGVIRARVADVKGYDRLYQALVARVELADVSASFVMEEIKETTELPL